MEYFSKLNKEWQDAIEAEIQDADGGERPEITAAWRESYARYLSECKIAQKPSKADLDEIGMNYTDFSMGWNAAVNHLAKDQTALIASWVREHGELTDYSDLENNDYEAYIVKKSDLVKCPRCSGSDIDSSTEEPLLLCSDCGLIFNTDGTFISESDRDIED